MNLTWEDKCFVCGKANPNGMRLDFAVNNKARTIETVWVPEATYQGYDNIIHGGLISTVLDEAMGKLSTCLGKPAVTAELTVKFRKPVPPDRPLTVRGRIVGERRRILLAEAEALLEDGTVAACASAKLMRENV